MPVISLAIAFSERALIILRYSSLVPKLLNQRMLSFVSCLFYIIQPCFSFCYVAILISLHVLNQHCMPGTKSHLSNNKEILRDKFN